MSDNVKNIKHLLREAKGVSKRIKGEKYDSLRIDCMNRLGIYTSTIDVNEPFRKWVEVRGNYFQKFSTNDVYNIRIYGVKPKPTKIDDALIKEPGLLKVDMRKLLNYETFRLQIEYHMDDEWLRGIVRSRSSPEPLINKTKYHLSAQLTDPSSLISGFSEFDIEEYPVNIRVGLQDRINMGIPEYVKDLSEIESRILNEKDPHGGTRVIGLLREKIRLTKKLGKEDLRGKLSELSLFLRPHKFIRYVNLEDNGYFRLNDCEWGNDFFQALGMMMLPKAMKIITRTDLNLDRSASSGTMIYESNKFEEDVKALFEKKRKSRRQS